MLKEEIKNLAGRIFERAIADRRHLHAHPEISFDEYQTAAFIKSRLDEMAIAWEAIAGNGIIAMISGDKPSNQVLALRADMDALPVTELNKLPFSSVHDGLMHACGHDAHMASLLGTAYILQELKSKFAGAVKLIFQPAEEKLPGGASLMIKEGVLENPVPAGIIGQHVMPTIPSGKIGMRKGKMMASMDEIYMTVHGRGGHGAMPHQNVDPVLITAHILVSLQQIVSRLNNPAIPGVLSFGKLVGNGSINVIPDSVYIEGTFRTMDERWRTAAHGHIKKMAIGIAESMGGACDINIIKGYPVLINEEKFTGELREFAEEYLGKENVIDADILMAAEDFAYYSQAIKACFYFLGTGNTTKEINSPLHSATFNIDEDALLLSAGLMAFITLRQLGNE